MRWDGKMYDKYRIEHTDGTPLKGKKYFVLRLDSDNPVEAARVEAAMRAYKGEVKTSASNAAAMREALVEIDELTNLLDIPEDKKNPLVSPSHSFIAVKMRRIIKKALEEPPRNCDMGTAEEQSRRFCNFCRPRLEPCDGCVCLDGSRKGRCEFVWAQMPYEKYEKEGGNNAD